MRRASLVVAIAAVAAVTVGACYDPHPANGGFQCTIDNQFQCPQGLTCDRGLGLCLTGPADLAGPAMDLRFVVDAGPPGARTCDERVRQGAFSNLVNVGSANSSSDESSLSITQDGKNIFFMREGGFMTATLNGKNSGVPQAVTISNGPAVLNGGSIAANGTLWFAGAATANGAATLYQGTLDAVSGSYVAVAQALPASTACSFFDPVFLNGSATAELYLTYPLGGCSGASYIARGANKMQLGTFYAATSLPQGSGLQHPSLTPDGLTLLFSTTDAHPKLMFAVRASTDSTNDDTQWNGPTPLSLGSIGAASGGDYQAVVSPDCSTLFLVADRAGGRGGLDLWAADIAQQ